MKEIGKHRSAWVLLVMVLGMTAACNKKWEKHVVHGSGVTDVEGNAYSTVIIGQQEWMAENLRVSHFMNGDQLQTIPGQGAVWDDTSYQWVYNDDPDLVDIYGRLYTWSACVDLRKIAPEGWHVATRDDWQNLVDYLGSDVAGKLRERGKGHWEDKIHFPRETNETGFSALPGGDRGCFGNFYGGNAYQGLGFVCHFWTSDSDLAYPDMAFSWELFDSGFEEHSDLKQSGFSIRCVKD